MTKFLSLLAALTVTAFFSDSSLPVAGVSALSIDSRHSLHARHGHNAISKRKRTESKRCKERPAPTSELVQYVDAPTTAASTPTADPTTSESSEEAQPTESNNGGNSGGSGGSSDGGSDDGGSSDSGSDSGNSNGDDNTDVDVPAPSGSSGDINKAGINWFDSPEKLALWTPASGKKGWMYNWTPEYSAGVPDNWEFVPMLWGWKFATDNWFDQVGKSGGQYVMSVNEPDQSGQANMDVYQLIDIYKKYMTPLSAQGYKIALPVTSSAPVGFDLIKSMIDKCGGDCPYDFVPVHWYDVDFDNFKDYVTKWHDEFKKPVWVTEFACQNFNGGSQCDEGKIWWFMTQATIWMDSTDWIERYCAFGTMRDMVDVNPLNQLMDPNTFAPNALGKLYLDLHI